MDNANIDLIRSHMDTIILRTIQNEDKYGLEILNEIKSLSDDLYTVKQPTLYSSLKRLESQGLILSYPGEETKGANRTYYRLTDEGRAFLEADQNQWEFARTIIDKLLSDKEFDKDAEKPFEPANFRPLTKRTKKETEEKVVIKYVEVEKPVYIDRKTGDRLDGYTPSVNEEEESFDNNIPNFAVYGNSNDNEDSELQYKKIFSDEAQTDEENQSIKDSYINDDSDNYDTEQPNVQTDEDLQEPLTDSSDIYEEDFSEEYNDYQVSSTQFTEDTYYDNISYTSQNAVKNTETEVNHNNYIDNNIDYVGMIEGILNETTDNKNTEKEFTPSDWDGYDSEITMMDLEQALESKNIKLRRYQKSNTVTYYSGKFFYSNKLLRDWSWITYTLYVAFILLSYICGRNTGIMWEYSLGFALGGILLPIACTVVWGKSPLRKKRNNVSLNNAMLSAIILMIAFMLVILIIAFFIAKINATNPMEYVPAIVVPICSLSLLPLSVVIYALLFKVKNYHLK